MSFKSVVLFLMVTALFLSCGPIPAMADCTATVEQVKQAHAVKKEALAARDSGNYQLAVAKYEQAAVLHPQEAYAASYLMNAVGCLLGKWNPAKGYQWDSKRGVQNAQAAYLVLDEVKKLLKKANDDGCEYSSGVIGNTEAWYSTQLAWLKSQVPRKK